MTDKHLPSDAASADLTVEQRLLLSRINGVIRQNFPTKATFEYRSQYLGYLPYGYYHWLSYDGKEIPLSDLPDWSLEDLLQLQTVGYLKETARQVSTEDSDEVAITFQLLPGKDDRSFNK